MRKSISERLRPPSCRHKNRYSTKGMAEQARKKRQQRYGWLLKVYECRHCHDYHLARVKVGGNPVPIVGMGREE